MEAKGDTASLFLACDDFLDEASKVVVSTSKLTGKERKRKLLKQQENELFISRRTESVTGEEEDTSGDEYFEVYPE